MHKLILIVTKITDLNQPTLVLRPAIESVYGLGYSQESPLG